MMDKAVDQEDVKRSILEFAERGFRSLGIARSESSELVPDSEAEWTLVALIPLFDPPRHDSHDTICK